MTEPELLEAVPEREEETDRLVAIANGALDPEPREHPVLRLRIFR